MGVTELFGALGGLNEELNSSIFEVGHMFLNESLTTYLTGKSNV